MPEDAFTPPEPENPPVPVSDRWDWVWNTLTVACLVYSTSCLIAILQPFVIGGLSVAEATAMIAQGTGVAVVSKGALTKDGKASVQKLLMKIGIAPRWYSEVTFAASVVILIVASSLHAALPKLGEFYLKQGQTYRTMGLLGEARRKFDKALELNPQKADTHLALGELDESLGELANAEKHYKQALAEGSLKAFDRLGRVYLAKGEATQAEPILQLGLSWVSSSTDLSYALNRNLGRALLAQQKYKQAERVLKIAIAQQKSLPRTTNGYGMANCFLSQVFSAQKQQASALQQLQYCQKNARPETLDEYQWLIKVGLHDIAQKVDTTAIVHHR